MLNKVDECFGCIYFNEDWWREECRLCKRAYKDGSDKRNNYEDRYGTDKEIKHFTLI
jgi:hypothetical protein